MSTTEASPSHNPTASTDAIESAGKRAELKVMRLFESFKKLAEGHRFLMKGEPAIRFKEELRWATEEDERDDKHVEDRGTEIRVRTMLSMAEYEKVKKDNKGSGKETKKKDKEKHDTEMQQLLAEAMQLNRWRAVKRLGLYECMEGKAEELVKWAKDRLKEGPKQKK